MGHYVGIDLRRLVADERRVVHSWRAVLHPGGHGGITRLDDAVPSRKSDGGAILDALRRARSPIVI